MLPVQRTGQVNSDGSKPILGAPSGGDRKIVTALADAQAAADPSPTAATMDAWHPRQSAVRLSPIAHLPGRCLRAGLQALRRIMPSRSARRRIQTQLPETEHPQVKRQAVPRAQRRSLRPGSSGSPPLALQLRRSKRHRQQHPARILPNRPDAVCPDLRRHADGNRIDHESRRRISQLMRPARAPRPVPSPAVRGRSRRAPRSRREPPGRR